MVWSNLPNQGVAAGLSSTGLLAGSESKGVKRPPKDAAETILDVTGQGWGEQSSLQRGSPAKPNGFRNSLENFDAVFQNFEGILFFQPSMAPLTTLSFVLFILSVAHHFR